MTTHRDETEEQAPSAALEPVASPLVVVAGADAPVAAGADAPVAAGADAPVAAAEQSGLSAIGPVASERKARDWALVLQSMTIWHAIHRSWDGFTLLVRAEDEARAVGSIERYEQENRDWPPRPVRERARHAGVPLAPLLFAALALFFVVTGSASGGSRWFERGASVADLTAGSQPWRAVTALTLHADSMHVLGNVISGAIFGTGVDRRLGRGASALAILTAGVIGNVANALWHHATGSGDHASIGASTAVFGAVGLLAATQIVVDRSHGSGTPRHWTAVVSPVVGGLALLGALGASPRADLGAHVFGFLGGLVLGLMAAWPIRRGGSPRWWLQTIFAALAAGIVLASWRLAMR